MVPLEESITYSAQKRAEPVQRLVLLFTLTTNKHSLKNKTISNFLFVVILQQQKKTKYVGDIMLLVHTTTCKWFVEQ